MRGRSGRGAKERGLSAHISLQIDPAEVLGVSREATLQEIREAYRIKVKRYHPDAGGEEWAFRILSQAYEIMSTARVVRATTREFDSGAASPRPGRGASAAQEPPRPGRAEPAGSGFSFRDATPEQRRARARIDPNETVRPGVQEPSSDLSRVVDVEKIAIRYEAEHIWLITDRSNEQRFLSCCLNISWPDPDFPHPPSMIAESDTILASLRSTFEELRVHSQAIASRSSVEEGRFTGWVSYPSADRATDAFVILRDLLHRANLVVKQWSRDLIIPRHWR